MADTDETQINKIEIEQNLRDYREQILEVEKLLLDDPTNEEYRNIYDGLAEIIELTEQLLTAEQQTASAVAADGNNQRRPVAAITNAPELRVPSVLPPQVAEQIRSAQQRAALAGQAPAAWAIGARVQAQYTDGQWYPASVTAVSIAGKFIVSFDGYQNEEEVSNGEIKQLESSNTSLTDGYQGLAAPKRHKVQDEGSLEEMPSWLEIKPTDDEKTKEKKKKLQKSYKSKQRFQKMDNVQKEKAESWKKFVASKGAKRKAGFMTGLKKDSIFKVSEAGKVGVTGSGKEMTAAPKRKKHEFL